MEQFIEYILQFGSLNPQQINLVRNKAIEIELPKDDYFWEAGKTIKQVGFVTEGVLRVYYYNNESDEITRYFITENLLILYGYDIDASYTPSEYLQAITDSRLVVFSKKDWKEISDTIVGWDTIIQKITAKQHGEKLERRSPLVEQDATTRYLEFIENFPTLVNRIPLSYIASYLGITQSSLSRIRKKISKK
ncbi:Crp/Fnr family transcriptional regulator [Sinomicrobium kalidii]|uniref:Crp/Fnr family transcriptional regulator n=1 Tax=Sinomicrobium kalidii TaxID=2900738 RepID=UPI001E40C360|nr:Crp/Fnr family transcriptional regulator [Sinomicrobium kalidii]UGU15459.1 Crp/Fnr family transcriptional regulator [Sinomicrobium kalidii]